VKSTRRRIKSKVDHNRYLITYADLITLLLGFFVILYTTSQIDGENYSKLQEALKKAFSSGIKPLLDGGDGVLDGNDHILPEPYFPGVRQGNIDSIQNAIKSNLISYFDSGSVTMVKEGESIKIDMPEKLLFSSGFAEIKGDGLKFLDSLADILSNVPNQITIDGHTDNVAIKNGMFESNWHLSTERALNIAYSMMQKGLKEQNVAVRGYGSQRPKETNSTEEGKAINRRVELIISKLDIQSPSTKGYSKDSIN